MEDSDFISPSVPGAAKDDPLPMPRASSADMLHGIVSLCRAIEVHVGPCTTEQALLIAFTLEEMGFIIARKP
ncbi:hypothetical protein [Acidocella sp.]|uniref:hypothetical protein n=1 Tax=Acidocella sp. TaxID=50710 RepID=UPI0026322B41|nr:hypothetical protein [Acidocella sp.]